MFRNVCGTLQRVASMFRQTAQGDRIPHPHPLSLAAREKGAEGGLRDDGVHLREQK
jgi:hypothetical protein